MVFYIVAVEQQSRRETALYRKQLTLDFTDSGIIGKSLDT